MVSDPIVENIPPIIDSITLLITQIIREKAKTFQKIFQVFPRESRIDSRKTRSEPDPSESI